MVSKILGFAPFAALISTSVASVLPRASQVICPGARHLAFDPRCCVWYDVKDDLVNLFQNTCGEDAHSTVRIAFHDAIGFSTTSNKGGGTDGSIIKFPVELGYAANAGIDDIVGDLQPIADARKVTYGDIIQFGSSVALSMCPGAPRVKTFIGRKNATAAAPDGTVPEPSQTVQAILARMADAGFSPTELVTLLASHSIAAQDELEPNIARSPFDSTPGAFDTQIFLETLLVGKFFPGANPPPSGEVHSPLHGEFRLESDANIARFSSTACAWQNFINQQSKMASAFSTAMTKMSLLGQTQSALVDCTEAIPNPPAAINKPATYPPQRSFADIQQACTQTPFPSLGTDAGAETTIAKVPAQ